MNHRIRAWGIRRPDGTLAGTAMWGGCVGFNGIALFPTRRKAREKLDELKHSDVLGGNLYWPNKKAWSRYSVVPVKGTFEW